jgi:8-oxo-dGTP pyrophosphatase MutT (NUDIX family)
MIEPNSSQTSPADTRIQFTVLASGIFSSRQVHVSYSDREQPYSSDALDLIERLWAKRLSSKTKIFDGKLFRVVSARVQDQELFVELENTSYKHFVGTRDKEFVSRFGLQTSANPLSVGVVTTTSDGYLMIGRRRLDLDFNPGKYSIVAGIMDRERDFVDHTPDPFNAILRELHEEKDIHSNDIERIVCLGLVYNQEYNQTYMPFEARLTLSRVEIDAKSPTEVEFDEFFYLQVDHDQLKSWILRNWSSTSQTCLANLLLFGEHKFGKDWSANAVMSN